MKNTRVKITYKEYEYIVPIADGARYDLFEWGGPYNRYQPIHGDVDNRRAHTVKRAGRAKGYPMLIRHNDLTDEEVDLIFDRAVYGYVDVILEEWSPEVGEGWQYVESFTAPYHWNKEEYLPYIHAEYGEDYTEDDIFLYY